MRDAVIGSTHHVSIWRDVKQYVIIDDWLKSHSNGKNSITYCCMDMRMREIRGTVISFVFALCNLLSLSL